MFMSNKQCLCHYISLFLSQPSLSLSPLSPSLPLARNSRCSNRNRYIDSILSFSTGITTEEEWHDQTSFWIADPLDSEDLLLDDQNSFLK